MTPTEQSAPTPCVIYCRCAYAQVIPADAKAGVLEYLCGRAEGFHAVADLCEMSARRDPRLQSLAATPGLTIAACHPRAVKWLFHAAEAPLPEDARFINMRESDPVAAAEKVLGGEI